MQSAISRIQIMLTQTADHIQNSSAENFDHKPSPEKWSKKEILGHLVDSAINNLQRFTEIQFTPKPFPIRRYRQNELVIANAYQETDIAELLALWLNLNKQIIHVISRQNKTTLRYEILMDENALSDLGDHTEKADLQFMITDYVDHMEHHLKQVLP